MAIKSFLMASLCYQYRKVPYEVKGGVFLRIAWLFREAGREDRERSFIERALENYTLAFETQSSISGKLGEDGLAYLIGELNRRLGNLMEAERFYAQVLVNRKARGSIRRMAEDQMELLRNTRKEGSTIEKR
ncbi:MAG: DUF2225 domain-containing protein [bacterium]